MSCKYVYKKGSKQQLESVKLTDLLANIASTNEDGISKLYNAVDDVKNIFSSNKRPSGANSASVTSIVDWTSNKVGSFGPMDNMTKFKSYLSILIGNHYHKAMEAFALQNAKDRLDAQLAVYNALRNELRKIYTVLEQVPQVDLEFTLDGEKILLTPAEQTKLLSGVNPIIPPKGSFKDFESKFISTLEEIHKTLPAGSEYLPEQELYVPVNDIINSSLYRLAKDYIPNAENLQGIIGKIDGVCISGGKIILYDYKTHLTNLSTPKAMAKAYMQLQLYKQLLLKASKNSSHPLDESQIEIRIVNINTSNFETNVVEDLSVRQQAFWDMQAQNIVGTAKVLDPDTKQTIENSYTILESVYSQKWQRKRNEEGLKHSLENVPKNNLTSKAYEQKKIIKYVPDQHVELDGGLIIPIQEFLAKEIEARRQYNRKLITKFKEAFGSPQKLMRLGKTDEQMKQFLYNLRIYSNQKNYEIITHAGLEEQGYILIRDKVTNKFNIVKFFSYEQGINKNAYGFLKGDNIFGDVLDDIEAKKFNNLPGYTHKDMEIIKILMLTSAFNEWGMFPNGFTLNDIILIDQNTGSIEPVLSIEQHVDALRQLKEHMGDTMPFTPHNINISSQSVRLERQVLVLLNSLNLTGISDITLEGLSLEQKILKIKELREKISSDPVLKQSLSSDRTNTAVGNDVELIYRKLGELQARLEGLQLNPNQVNDWSVDYKNTFELIGGVFKNRDMVASLNKDGYTTTGLFCGRQFASAYNNPDNIVFELDQLTNATNDTIRRIVIKDTREFHKASEKFLSLISTTKRMLNHDDHYKQLFDLDSNGELAPSMTFKNPYVSSLPSGVREYLEIVLWQKNKYSMKGVLSEEERLMSYEEFKKTDKFDTYKEKIKESKNRYYPLRQVGAIRAFQEKMKGNLKNPKDFAEIIWSEISTHLEPSQYNKEQKAQRKLKERELKMYNPYDVDEDTRNKSIENHGVNYFDLNVDSIMMHYTMAHIKEHYYNQLLAQADLIFGSLSELERMTGQNMDKTRQMLKDRLAIAVYGRNITDDDFEDLNKLISVARSFVSATKIAARPLLLAKELTVGTMKLAAKCRFGYFENLNINEKTLAKSMRYVYGRDLSSKSKKLFGQESLAHMPLISALNAQYGIANFDLNIMAERLQADRFGMGANIGRSLYATSTVPDFYNRMSIFIAAMIADGCFDAHSLDPKTGELIYDISKDKRFAKFWKLKNGPKSSWDEEFFEQKGLFIAMAREFNQLSPGTVKIEESGNDVSQWKYDSLPAAYTPKQKASINEQITTVFGAYDHELSMTFKHGQYALFFTQFMSYMSGEFKKLFGTIEGNTNIGKLVKMKDKNGLYIKEGKTIDPNTNLPVEYTQQSVDDGIITQEEFDQMPFKMGWSGHPVEGLAVSTLKTIKDITSGKLKEKLNSDDPMDKQQIANTKVFLFNLLFYAFCGSLLGMFLGLLGYEDEEEMGYVMAQGYKMLSKNVAQEFSITQSIIAPIADLGFIGVDQIEQLSQDALSMITKEDYNVMNFIYENISAFKDTQFLE